MRTLAMAITLTLATAPLLAVEPDKLLPADADAVATVNVKALLKSALVRQYWLEQIRTAIEENAELAPLLGLLDLDPLEDLDTITVAVRDPAAPSTLVIVRGRFARERVVGVASLIAFLDPKSLGVAERGGIRIFRTRKADPPMFLAFPNDETLLLSWIPGLVEQAIDQSQAAEPLGLDAELQQMLRKVPGEPTIWLAVAGTERVKEEARSNPDLAEYADSFLGAYASLTITDGVRLALSLATDDFAAAQAAKAELESGREALRSALAAIPNSGPLLAATLHRAVIEADGGRLALQMEVSGETIDTVLMTIQETIQQVMAFLLVQTNLAMRTGEWMSGIQGRVSRNPTS